MSESELTVRDRRGGNGNAQPEEPARPARAKPVGTPILFFCDSCGEDISRHCSVMQIPLPQILPNGTLTFQPQAVFVLPVICPHCGEPRVHQQSIIPVHHA